MDDVRAEFLIAACRAGIIRAQLIQAELESVSIVLKGGLISPEAAVAWLKSAGMLEYFVAPVPKVMTDEGNNEKAGS